MIAPTDARFPGCAYVINAEAFNAWPCRHHAGRWSQTPNLPGGAPRCVRLRSPTPLNVGLYETPARQAGFVKRADFNVMLAEQRLAPAR